MAARTAKPFRLSIRFGESYRAPPRNYTFDSAGERAAFLKGVEAMDGWGGYDVLGTNDAPEAAFVAPLHSASVALAAMCLWEAVCEDRHGKGEPGPWESDRENEGTCALRDRVFSLAAQCDSDWSEAQRLFGYDDCFDWDFAPRWLRHNYGQFYRTPAERLAWLEPAACRSCAEAVETRLLPCDECGASDSDD